MLQRIVPLIATVQEHLAELDRNPERYRPECCPHPKCGRSGGMRFHGSYERKPCRGKDWRGTDARELGPVKVQRCRCRYCLRTCSSLPSCLPARRWYLWSLQAAVLLQLLAGASVRACAREHGPDRHTVLRWRRWLQDGYARLAHHLRRRTPVLGLAADWRDFWQRCLSGEPLHEVMAWLHGKGLHVP
jgi:transposase-like protein